MNRFQFYRGWQITISEHGARAYRFGVQMRARNRRELETMIDLRAADDPFKPCDRPT